MRNMKKTVAWILGLVMRLSLGAAAAESKMPEIPTFQDVLNVRPIGSEEEAIAYAKGLVESRGGSVRIHSVKGKMRKE